MGNVASTRPFRRSNAIPETYRGGGNSADGGYPIDFIRDVATDFPKMQPWNVFGWVGIWGIRQSLADEHGVTDTLELRSRTEVPDRRNPSGAVLDEIVLREDSIRGDDVGEGVDQLLDGGTVGTRPVPNVEHVIGDSR